MIADTLLVVVGTRPEVIKMAPVVRAMRARPESFRVRLCVVGQQTAILERALEEWELATDLRIELPDEEADPAQRLAAMLPRVASVIGSVDPRLVLVQGDTTTTLAGALAAAFSGRRVAHVEAGLRSSDPSQPFPEEMNRRLVDHVADVLYAPTVTAREHLLREGIDDARIVVIGNTVTDAVEIARRGDRPRLPSPPRGRRLILVTGHRRESFGRGLDDICRTLRRLVLERDDVELVYVLHPHPEAQLPARRWLGGLPRVELSAPQDYRTFLGLLEQAWMVISDSGGVQEEAPLLGTPTLVTRERTERPEAIAAGVARLVGSRPRSILREARRLLDDPQARAAMARRVRPFGEPGAAERLCDDLARRLRRSRAS